MNARNPKTSRLGELLAYLKKCGKRGATTWELAWHCKMLSVATCASELRHAGYQVVCKRDGTSDKGAKIFRYYVL